MFQRKHVAQTVLSETSATTAAFLEIMYVFHTAQVMIHHQSFT